MVALGVSTIARAAGIVCLAALLLAESHALRVTQCSEQGNVAILVDGLSK